MKFNLHKNVNAFLFQGEAILFVLHCFCFPATRKANSLSHLSAVSGTVWWIHPASMNTNFPKSVMQLWPVTVIYLSIKKTEETPHSVSWEEKPVSLNF